jgi:hypothetical protein
MEFRNAIVESGNAPVFFFDDVGEMVVKNDRIWYPLFITKPSIAMPGEFDNELVAWTTCPLRIAPSIIARAYHTIKPHRMDIPTRLWSVGIAANHH